MFWQPIRFDVICFLNLFEALWRRCHHIWFLDSLYFYFYFYFFKQTWARAPGMHLVSLSETEWSLHRLYCFIVFAVVTCRDTYEACEILQGNFQLFIKITCRVSTLKERRASEHQAFSLSLSGVRLRLTCRPAPNCGERLRISTWTGTSSLIFSFFFFLSQQDLHFSTEAGFEQRVWLLSLLVKCLKKTCNLNCCRAHQYEIGWMWRRRGGVGGRETERSACPNPTNAPLSGWEEILECYLLRVSRVFSRRNTRAAHQSICGEENSNFKQQNAWLIRHPSLKTPVPPWFIMQNLRMKVFWESVDN